jgi:hypothetical protein
MLRSAFPRVALELHHNDRALGSIGSTGAWASGYHLPLRDAAHGALERKALHELDARCRALFAQGLLPFVDGFAEAAGLDITRYQALAFATGETLWPSREAPAPLPAPRPRPQRPQRAARATTSPSAEQHVQI